MTALDRRLNAFRGDLADKRLAGQVEAARFVEGRRACVVSSVADLRRDPSPECALQTQLLKGDSVRIFDEHEGWAWVQAERDGYVGYSPTEALGPIVGEFTHRVVAPRTFLYVAADMRTPMVGVLSLGSEITVSSFAETRGTSYALLATGEAMVASHLAARDEHAADYVAVAENLLNTPYLWGGATAFGIDCSGLVQLALRMAGRDAPRDSDMQALRLGAPIDPAKGLRRGDLVFWKGHVAILTDPETLIHANGHTMMVSLERLDDVVSRIGYLYGQPTGFRRLG